MTKGSVPLVTPDLGWGTRRGPSTPILKSSDLISSLLILILICQVHDRLVKLDSVILESCVRLKSGNGSRQLNADDIRSAESRLLEEVFPPHVAKQLREGRPVETERFDHTTIFFSDIVGFTTIADEFGNPEKVVDLLGRLYSKFDGLSRKHGVFKVETIGGEREGGS